MRARHILIKHSGSRRPASWKDPEGREISRRSKAEAVARLEELREGIGGEDDFARVASEVSDCSSAKNGGDLGPFESGQMMKPFEDAVLSLPLGGISGVVETDSGVHIIMRLQ